MHSLTESKSIEILNLLAETPDLSQRRIASESGSSLGMVNLVIRRLARTGYIKIVNLDRRKVRYILTAKGLAEKANRSYHYVIRSIRAYHSFHHQLETIVNGQMARGKETFTLVGEGEIAELLKVILQRKGCLVKCERLEGAEAKVRLPNEVVFHCNLNNHAVEGISVLEALLKSHNRNLLEGEFYELV